MSLEIKNVVKNANSFAVIAPIVKEAREEISSRGRRYIYVKGYEGTLGINELATQILIIIGEEFPENERDIGKEIAPKIVKLYEQNDERLKTKKIMTRILCFIRDFFNGYRINKNAQLSKYEYASVQNWSNSEIRLAWCSQYSQVPEFYKYYTFSQYCKKFHCSPPLSIPWEADIDEYPRWLPPSSNPVLSH